MKSAGGKLSTSVKFACGCWGSLDGICVRLCWHSSHRATPSSLPYSGVREVCEHGAVPMATTTRGQIRQLLRAAPVASPEF